MVKNIMQKVLILQSYEVLSACNGQEVYDVILANEVDMVLLDISMPVMDGITCVKKIRQEAPEGKRQVPVLAITGNAANFQEADFRAAGIDDYLLKPVNYDLLMQKITHYLTLNNEA